MGCRKHGLWRTRHGTPATAEVDFGDTVIRSNALRDGPEAARRAQRSAMREVRWLSSGLKDALRVLAKLREQHTEA
jgi:hypothetical protein